MAPTIALTVAPTITPTRQTVPILSFDTTVTIGGATSSLDMNGQKAVVNATATSMGISQNDVTYKGGVVTTELRRRLLSGVGLFSTTYKIVATTGIVVLVTSGSAEDLYVALTNAVKTAVSTGQFTTNLQRAAVLFNFPALADANVTSATTSDPVTDNPDSEDDPVLSNGAIAGIVIGGVFILGLISAIVFLQCRQEKTRTKIAAYS